MSQFIFPPLTASLDSEASSGAALPSAQMIVGGFFSGTSVVYPLAVDAAGQLQVDVLSTTGPSNYATDTLQTAGNVLLTTISTKDFATQTTLATLATQTTLASLEGKDFATQTTLATIDADTSKIAGAVDAGGQMQVDIVADGAGLATSALQGTANTLLTTISTKDFATQTTLATLATQATLVTIDSDTSILAAAVTANKVQVDVIASLPAGSNNIGDVDVLSLPADSKNYVWKEGLDSTVVGITDTILDTSTTNIPSGTQLTVATLTNDIYEIQTVEDIGEFIGIYAASALKAILPLGGGSVKINLPSTTVVKLASFSGTPISSGKIAINFLG
jgi:hypothetical protein